MKGKKKKRHGLEKQMLETKIIIMGHKKEKLTGEEKKKIKKKRKKIEKRKQLWLEMKTNTEA